MNYEKAWHFLLCHQPMPADEHLTPAIIAEYDNVRKFFIEHPNPKVIELFLRSYGAGDGWGVYQLVEDFFDQCSEFEVKQGIKTVIEDYTISDGVRYWVTQLAGAFNDARLRKGLELSLQSKNPDIRDAAKSAMQLLD